MPFRRDRGESGSFTQDASLLIELYQSVLLILPLEELLTGTYHMFVHAKVAFERDDFVVKMETLVTGAKGGKKGQKGLTKVKEAQRCISSLLLLSKHMMLC